MIRRFAYIDHHGDGEGIEARGARPHEEGPHVVAHQFGLSVGRGQETKEISTIR